MAEIFMMLVAFFITGPFQADLSARLASARAPAAVVNLAMAQVQECATAAVPTLASRAVDDPWWGITTLAGIAFGLNEPRPVLTAAVPACAAAIATVEPLLKGSAT